MTKKSDKTQEPPRFEDALAQLEQTVHELEEGEIDLADALAKYEQGVACLRQCYELLEKAEQRIVELSGVDDQGNPVTRPFRGEDADADRQQAASRRRSKLRSAPPGPQPEPDDGENDMDEGRSLF